ncbi:HAD family hydrolase [Lentilactobacillus parafarraginis]|jgi:putative hydrolase of the HAD superfamily|uniref:Haloacid dehalogenase-like hydrolase n=2 Tax=Lentilactobacillus parafarraginis TaxID=390842 RepID=A0A0R1YTA9_9LACO|nr:HAD family hydrolase [Lentilactobacillus parafarraginis]KRM45410.1 haloacid dehalogenase-like hydrolase [Lentilactobacillus parafarraginis DSM 18390 = JCM 14109]TLQ20980.1 HAD family hydrolase [Lentilactobacillus parafarraginis]
MIKAIVFDVDDTLYDPRPSFERAFKQVFANEITDDLMDHFYCNYLQQEQLVEAKSNQEKDLKLSKQEITFHCLHHSFKEFALNGLTQQKAQQFSRQYTELTRNIKLFDGLTTVFNKLTEKFTLGIITNGATDIQLAKIMRLKLHHWFGRERIITSEDADTRKPDPMIFTLMNRKLELHGNEMIYVGSSYLTDIVPAKKAGWQTVWYNNHNGTIADPSIIPDQTVNNSAQLQELLLELAAEA